MCIRDRLAAGRPVAINYGGWQADLVRESGAGLVLDRQDIRAAAGQLVQALGDRRWLVRAGAAARNLARTRFDRDQLTAELETVLVGVARASGTAPRSYRSSLRLGGVR